MEAAIIVGACTAFPAVVAAFISWLNRKNITRIQVNVDGRLDAAFNEITALKAALVIEKILPAEGDDSNA